MVAGTEARPPPSVRTVVGRVPGEVAVEGDGHAAEWVADLVGHLGDGRATLVRQQSGRQANPEPQRADQPHRARTRRPRGCAPDGRRGLLTVEARELGRREVPEVEPASGVDRAHQVVQHQHDRRRVEATRKRGPWWTPARPWPSAWWGAPWAAPWGCSRGRHRAPGARGRCTTPRPGPPGSSCRTSWSSPAPVAS